MPIATTKSDSQIKTDVLNELKWDPAVDETEIGVQVNNGVVTLTGGINAYAKKLAAAKAAHRVYGVLDVVDELRVVVPTVSRRTDQEIAAAVRNALKWDSVVPDERIKSTVAGGVVVLEGSVDNWIDRHNAERAIQRLAGVTDVENRISIAPRTIDAAQIKRQIEEALERQAECEAKRLRVSVSDGVVVVSGTLGTWGEKSAMERVTWATPGVKRVVDQTTIDPNQ
jgi:osmotically-inducible protein OsmY